MSLLTPTGTEPGALASRGCRQLALFSIPVLLPVLIVVGWVFLK